jgi:hypothetical protein
MIRTILTIGIVAILGLFALRIAFGVLVVAFGIFGALLVLTLKIALIGGAVYLVIRVVSPETARKLRARSTD